MIHWNPSCTAMESWEPKQGWNAMFSERDKIQATNLYFFLKKKVLPVMAENMAQMILFQQIYHLTYSEEQEAMLRKVMQPILQATA